MEQWGSLAQSLTSLEISCLPLSGFITAQLYATLHTATTSQSHCEALMKKQTQSMPWHSMTAFSTILQIPTDNPQKKKKNTKYKQTKPHPFNRLKQFIAHILHYICTRNPGEVLSPRNLDHRLNRANETCSSDILIQKLSNGYIKVSRH